MALDIPNVDLMSVKPGGGINQAMSANNALADEMFKAKLDAVKAQYAPMTAQADAEAKQAYARLLGPQYTAKLFGNEDVRANLTDDQKRTIQNALFAAGAGASVTPQVPQNALTQIPSQPPKRSMSSYLEDEIKNIFNKSKQVDQTQESPNALINVDQGYSAPQTTEDKAEIVAATDAWMKSPEAKAQGDKEGFYQVPDNANLLSWYKGKQLESNLPAVSAMQAPTADQITSHPTYAENVGEYLLSKEEGKESGKIRADQIKDLDDTYYNTKTSLATLDDLGGILQSKEFESIRQNPILGHHELSYYAKFGSPEQQRLVGRYYTDTGNVIKDSASDFKGQFRVGEQKLLNGMKANPSDTVDAARGKVESLTYFQKMLSERSRLTSRIMDDYKINKGKASEIADKMLKGDKIRAQAQDKIYPPITLRNKKTGESKTLPYSEAQKLLKIDME